MVNVYELRQLVRTTQYFVEIYKENLAPPIISIFSDQGNAERAARTD